jgi:hypothetical protein
MRALHFCCCEAKMAQLKVEHSAQTTFRFSPHGAVFPDAAIYKDTPKWQIRKNQIRKNQLPVSDTR